MKIKDKTIYPFFTSTIVQNENNTRLFLALVGEGGMMMVEERFVVNFSLIS